jgi:hypothetical protein
MKILFETKVFFSPIKFIEHVKAFSKLNGYQKTTQCLMLKRLALEFNLACLPAIFLLYFLFYARLVG